MNSRGNGVAENWVLSRWPGAESGQYPYRHWLLKSALPKDLARDLAMLPVSIPAVDDTQGRRETHNATRWFFTPGHQHNHSACHAIANVFQSAKVVRMLQWLTGAELKDTFLRVEYCQDRSGFWLEPHTDIGAKRFTALVYLTEGEDGENLGTDIFDPLLESVATAPGGFNKGLIFVPGADTWHGFRAREFEGVRTSIIINYVGKEWRSRHELCFPDDPVR